MSIYDKFSIGDRVQLINSQMSYGYRDSPPYNSMGILSHAVGIIGAIKVPYITRKRKDYPYFVCVDYEIDGIHHRVGASYKNIRKIK